MTSSQPPTPPVVMPKRTSGWTIGRVSGAPVILSPSWFIAAVVLTVFFAPTAQHVVAGVAAYLVAFGFVLLLFISVLCHEAAHAVVARWRGYQVTELALTLWGGHTAYTGGSKRPVDGFLVAVVGPLSNLVLAGGFWAAFHAVGRGTVLGLLLFFAALSNAFVGLFNLLPGLPLDGGQVLESAVWAGTGSRERGIVVAGWAGRLVAVGVLAWAVWSFVFASDNRELSTLAWAVLIAVFLWRGAGQALASGRRRRALAALAVRDLMVAAVTAPLTTPIATIGDLAPAESAVLLTDSTGAIVAILDTTAAADVPAEVAHRTAALSAAISLPAVGVDWSLAGQDLLTALSEIGDEPAWVVVTQGGAAVGALEIARVIAALGKALGTGAR